VWSRIWAVLSQYFIAVGCQPNLAVAMYAVDSLRQLAMKFLERDELANYTFQNDFLRPFVVVMRQSQVGWLRDAVAVVLSARVCCEHMGERDSCAAASCCVWCFVVAACYVGVPSARARWGARRGGCWLLCYGVLHLAVVNRAVQLLPAEVVSHATPACSISHDTCHATQLLVSSRPN
jgi:hypothetical protein